MKESEEDAAHDWINSPAMTIPTTPFNPDDAESNRSISAAVPDAVLLTRKVMGIFSLILLGLVAIFVCTLFLDETGRRIFVKENGIIESISALGYVFCAIYLFVKGRYGYVASHWYFIVFLVFLGLREWDFHNRFTTMGIFKSRWFLSPDVPIVEKSIGMLVLVCLVATVIAMAKRHAGDFIIGLKRRGAISWGVFSAIALVLIAKSIDGIPRKLEEFGFTLSDLVSRQVVSIEEILELGIPSFLVVTAWLYFNALKTADLAATTELE